MNKSISAIVGVIAMGCVVAGFAGCDTLLKLLPTAVKNQNDGQEMRACTGCDSNV